MQKNSSRFGADGGWICFAASLLAASLVLAASAADALAERVVPTAVAARCRLGPGHLEGAPLYLIHACIPDRELMQLTRLALQETNGAFRREEAKLANLSTILGLPQSVLEQFLVLTGQQDVAAEKLADQLVEMSEAHKLLISGGLFPWTPGRPELDALIIGARDAAQSGRYDDAQAQLTKASVAAETEAQNAPETSAAHFALAASARAALGQIALIRSQYREAAIYFEAALRLLADGDAARQFAYREARANALYLQGKLNDDAGALRDAIEHYRTLIDAPPRDGAPAPSATLRLNLGDALLRLGVRTGETEPLEQAATLFRNALEQLRQTRKPLDWARAQQELGATLLRLGLAEPGTGRLQEAVAAFRESLKEYTRTRAPLEWATVQASLGTALFTIGGRETGYDRFQAAVAAYREGLKQINRDYTPLDWAARQNNLGAALMALSERKSSLTSLQEAVAAFRSSLEAYQDESATYYIGGVKDNLERAERALRQFRLTGRMPRD